MADASDSSASEGEADSVLHRNRATGVPRAWYAHTAHRGYDVHGRRLAAATRRTRGEGATNIDTLLERADDPRWE
jgi:hypothetical protein